MPKGNGSQRRSTGDATKASSLEKLLDRYPTAVRELALAARRFVLAHLSEAREIVDEADGVCGYGYGPGYNDLICTLILSKTGVKLGIVRGADLPDPDGVLEGGGKVHRYVQLREPADLRRAELARMVASAERAWRARAAAARPTARRRN